MRSSPSPTCPLCKSNHSALYHRDIHREYLHCPECSLVFVPPRYHLSRAAEKAEYDLHQNSPEDTDYRQFLNRLFEPIHARLSVGSAGLDFGCGPAPTLSRMFKEQGHTVAVYDKYYADDATVFQQQYDFITVSEVVEHLRRPGDELTRLWRFIKPDGLLGIMTKRVRDLESFKTWHYIRDLTHVCFFSEATFEWLARQWRVDCIFFKPDVVLYKK